MKTAGQSFLKNICCIYNPLGVPGGYNNYLIKNVGVCCGLIIILFHLKYPRRVSLVNYCFIILLLLYNYYYYSPKRIMSRKSRLPLFIYMFWSITRSNVVEGFSLLTTTCDYLFISGSFQLFTKFSCESNL